MIVRRKEDSHKGQNGIVLVIGGSKNLVGALYLAAESIAAMRAGSDLVIVAAPEKVAWTINKMSPDLITVKLKGDNLAERHYDELKMYIDKADVILIGNGIGQEEKTRKLVKKIIKTKKPKVIDADAIKAIRLQEVDNSILTPHAREFEILMNNSKIKNKNIKQIQNKLKNNIILLKGKTDKIISKNKIKDNKTGNAGMSVGGTGDVLAGLCAGFVSQRMNLFDSAYLAAKITGKIGDELKKELGYGFVASDFLKLIAKAIKKEKL